MDVIPPVIAVAVGLILRQELPHKGFWAGSIRDIISVAAGAAIYVVGRVLVEIARTPAKLRRDWYAWAEPSVAANVVLGFACTVPELVPCRHICCEVTDPAGNKAFRAQGVGWAPSFEDGDEPLRFNYPADFFGNVRSDVSGLCYATWYMQEDTESDQWYEVKTISFPYQGVEPKVTA